MSFNIISKQVPVFLESTSRVYELIWKELSLSVANTAKGRIFKIAWSRMLGLLTP